MKAYADTGFLVSVHCRDAHTQRALERMKSQALPMGWTWLHGLEFRNALRLRVFRSEMTAGELALVIGKLNARTQDGVYVPVNVPDTAMAEAERLSAAFSASLGTRSLDILHVAYALVLQAEEFLTFDKRQAALATAAGLKVPAI